MHIICGCRHLADRSTCCDQFIIGAPLSHEFIMCALFYNNSVRHHCYDVSSLDSREPVSDDDAGSSFSCLVQSSLDSLQENTALSWTHSSRKHLTLSKSTDVLCQYVEMINLMYRKTLLYVYSVWFSLEMYHRVPFHSLCPGQRWLHLVTVS